MKTPRIIIVAFFFIVFLNYHSVHKNGNRIKANASIKIVRLATIKIMPQYPSMLTAVTEDTDTLDISNNKGIAIGNPNIAVIAAPCCACAAIADKKVNNMDRLPVPNMAIL